ncbi:MAG: phosphomethylpyrimidine synthase ThiC [bacterium]
MENLIEVLKLGEIPEVIEEIAFKESISTDILVQRILDGKAVILNNSNHKLNSDNVCAIGEGLKTKVNANIGTSSDSPDLYKEIRKLSIAIQSGADTVMDLSTSGNIADIRKALLSACTVPFGTVPIYEMICGMVLKGKNIRDMDPEMMFDTIIKQAEDGVDFMTIHCGVTRQTVEVLKHYKRLAGIVSRGGAFLAEWILTNNKENPFYEHFDRLLEIAKKYNLILSLGDGLRPGCLADASDSAQLSELYVLGELTKIAWHAGVGVIIEGPGHLPLHQIKANIELQKSVCNGAPFYVLGPLVCDIAPGYDHITSAIGGAIAASHGADFLCYVTPSEHIGIPTEEDVKQGVIASRISAHAGDIAKGIPNSMEWDNRISLARKRLDWKTQEELSIDPQTFRNIRQRVKLKENDVCSMCGTFCSMREMNRVFNNEKEEVKLKK